MFIQKCPVLCKNLLPIKTILIFLFFINQIETIEKEYKVTLISVYKTNFFEEKENKHIFTAKINIDTLLNATNKIDCEKAQNDIIKSIKNNIKNAYENLKKTTKNVKSLDYSIAEDNCLLNFICSFSENELSKIKYLTQDFLFYLWIGQSTNKLSIDQIKNIFDADNQQDAENKHISLLKNIKIKIDNINKKIFLDSSAGSFSLAGCVDEEKKKLNLKIDQTISIEHITPYLFNILENPEFVSPKQIELLCNGNNAEESAEKQKKLNLDSFEKLTKIQIDAIKYMSIDTYLKLRNNRKLISTDTIKLLFDGLTYEEAKIKQNAIIDTYREAQKKLYGSHVHINLEDIISEDHIKVLDYISPSLFSLLGHKDILSISINTIKNSLGGNDYEAKQKEIIEEGKKNKGHSLYFSFKNEQLEVLEENDQITPALIETLSTFQKTVLLDIIRPRLKKTKEGSIKINALKVKFEEKINILKNKADKTAAEIKLLRDEITNELTSETENLHLMFSVRDNLIKSTDQINNEAKAKDTAVLKKQEEDAFNLKATQIKTDLEQEINNVTSQENITSINIIDLNNKINSFSFPLKREFNYKFDDQVRIIEENLKEKIKLVEIKRKEQENKKIEDIEKNNLLKIKETKDQELIKYNNALELIKNKNIELEQLKKDLTKKIEETNDSKILLSIEMIEIDRSFFNLKTSITSDIYILLSKDTDLKNKEKEFENKCDLYKNELTELVKKKLALSKPNPKKKLDPQLKDTANPDLTKSKQIINPPSLDKPGLNPAIKWSLIGVGGLGIVAIIKLLQKQKANSLKKNLMRI